MERLAAMLALISTRVGREGVRRVEWRGVGEGTAQVHPRPLCPPASPPPPLPPPPLLPSSSWLAPAPPPLLPVSPAAVVVAIRTAAGQLVVPYVAQFLSALCGL